MRYISFNFQLVYIDKCQYGLAGLDILEFLYVDFTYISVEGGYKAGIFQFIDGSVESSFGRSIFRTCFLISTGRKVVFLIKRTDTLILCLCLAIDGFSTFTPDAVVSWIDFCNNISAAVIVSGIDIQPVDGATDAEGQFCGAERLGDNGEFFDCFVAVSIGCGSFYNDILFL